MYQENLEQIIRQNKKETKAINDHIEAIEKRVNSEKAALKEKLTELQENKYNSVKIYIFLPSDLSALIKTVWNPNLKCGL